MGIAGSSGCGYQMVTPEQEIPGVWTPDFDAPPPSSHHPAHGHGNRPGRSAISELSLDGVRTRLCILSDIHLCTYDDYAVDKLSVAFSTLGWMAPGINAFFLLGDVTLNGYSDELQLFATRAAEYLQAQFSPAPPLHLLMGNHDYWGGNQTQFESIFAQHVAASLFVAEQNTRALLDGVTIIKLNGPGSYAVDEMDYTIAYDFLAMALEEAAVNRPDDAILVMAHEPPKYMQLPETYEFGNYGQDTSRDMIRLIEQYPQCRMFSGHIHNPLDIPETVNNDLGFTSIHTSTVGSSFFIRGELVEENESGSQGLVLDVMQDGTLLLHRLDFYEQEYIDEPLEI